MQNEDGNDTGGIGGGLIYQEVYNSTYETGKIDIKVSILRDIAKVLNTTAGYLMDGDEMGFDADVMQLAMMLQEMKNEDVRKVAIEQVKVLAKLNKDA